MSSGRKVHTRCKHVVTLCFCCSEAYGLQDFYKQTQEQLQIRRDALHSGSQPERLVMDGDVATMTVKFERSVKRSRPAP